MENVFLFKNCQVRILDKGIIVDWFGDTDRISFIHHKYIDDISIHKNLKCIFVGIIKRDEDSETELQFDFDNDDLDEMIHQFKFKFRWMMIKNFSNGNKNKF